MKRDAPAVVDVRINNNENLLYIFNILSILIMSKEICLVRGVR